MPDYAITQISHRPPRAWSFTDKKTGDKVHMETYVVMVAGEEDQIDVNRKPGNPPKVGDVLTGTLEESDFGKKFKPDKKGSPFFAPRDQESIKAQWAIGQAIAMGATPSQKGMSQFEGIEETAKELFAMVDRVKSAPPPVATVFSDGTPIPENLDNIPF